MLLSSRSRQTVLVLPVLLFLFASGMAAGCVNAVLRHMHWGAVLSTGLFSGVVFWMALDELKLLWVDGAKLRLWGPFRRRELKAEACVFGLRLHTGTRSSSYVVFATDASTNVDVGEWQTERGARGGVERLNHALYGAMPRSPSTRAVREVEQVEGEWKASQNRAQKTIDDYYKSPGWRRGKYVIAAVVIAYSLGMVLYQYLTGKL